MINGESTGFVYWRAVKNSLVVHGERLDSTHWLSFKVAFCLPRNEKCDLDGLLEGVDRLFAR